MPPYSPECRLRGAVRTVTSTSTMPRSPTVTAGVSGSGMPLSNTIATSAPRSSARTHSATASPARSSSPSTSTRTCTGSVPSRAIAQATCSSGRKLPLSSAAPRAYRRPSRTSGSNGGESQASAGPGPWTS